jgi:hypothetical protein
MCKSTFSYFEGWQQRLLAKVLLRLHQQFHWTFEEEEFTQKHYQKGLRKSTHTGWSTECKFTVCGTVEVELRSWELQNGRNSKPKFSL